MNRKLETILQILREELPGLKEKYKISSVEVFGSYTRKDFSKKSDLDLLISFKETPSLLKIIELENHLSDILNIKVDLVMRDSLKPRIRDKILNEALEI
jgi:predicted nucleotidyltransferase